MKNWTQGISSSFVSNVTGLIVKWCYNLQTHLLANFPHFPGGIEARLYCIGRLNIWGSEEIPENLPILQDAA